MPICTSPLWRKPATMACSPWGATFQPDAYWPPTNTGPSRGSWRTTPSCGGPLKNALCSIIGLKVSKACSRRLNKNRYRITMDRAFERVIRGCQEAPRDGEGTWITDDIVRAYVDLHALGLAHSVEAWKGDELVGGLYGVSLGRMFFGESMFSTATNASKVAFVHLVRWLAVKGFGPVDCQIMNPHLASLGATTWPREAFQVQLAHFLHAGPTLKGPWTAYESELTGHA